MGGYERPKSAAPSLRLPRRRAWDEAGAVVSQGIYFTGIDRNWSNLIIGIMLLIAVTMNETFRRMAIAYAPKKRTAV